MRLNLLNIGFGNFIISGRIVAVISPGSAPVKRIKEVAKTKGLLIDATYGRKTRAIVVMDSEHVVLSAINPDTIASRLDQKVLLNQPDPESIDDDEED